MNKPNLFKLIQFIEANPHTDIQSGYHKTGGNYGVAGLTQLLARNLPINTQVYSKVIDSYVTFFYITPELTLEWLGTRQEIEQEISEWLNLTPQELLEQGFFDYGFSLGNLKKLYEESQLEKNEYYAVSKVNSNGVTVYFSDYYDEWFPVLGKKCFFTSKQAALGVQSNFPESTLIKVQQVPVS